MNKLVIPAITGVLLISTAVVAQPARNTQGNPCYDVNIQMNPENRAQIEQECERNFSRTMQAGQNNTAITTQSGDINSDAVRQYGFDVQQRQPRGR